MSVSVLMLQSLLDEPDQSKKHEYYGKMLKAGVTVDYFDRDEYKDVFTYIGWYYNTYHQVPSRHLVEAEKGVRFTPNPLDDPFEVYLDMTVQAYLDLYCLDGLKYIGGLYAELGALDREKRNEVLLNLAKKITTANLDYSNINTIGSLGLELLENHDQQQRALIAPGVKFGISYIDQVTGGAQPGDLWVIAGDTGSGKTFCTLRCALGAALGISPELLYRSDGTIRPNDDDVINDVNDSSLLGPGITRTRYPQRKVLYISMEMSNYQIANRGISLGAQINSTALRLGEMSHFGMVKTREFLDWWRANNLDEKFILVEGNTDLTVETVVNLVAEHKPDLVVVDGAYMLRQEGKKNTSRWEDILTVIERLKRVSLEFRIPIIGTYQFNQKAKERGLSDIMGGQAVGHTASVVLGLRMSDNSTTKGNASGLEEKQLEILKGRSGESGAVVLEFDLVRSIIKQSKVYNGLSEFMEGVEQNTEEAGEQREESEVRVRPPVDQGGF